MSTRWQTKRDTAANWTSNDPVLLNGEIGYETDTGKAKIGNGSTAWSSLPYNICRLNNVVITGGSITGITDLAVADGGTGASTAAAACTNLGVGTGDSPQFAAVNIGHAADTTVTRTGAGDIAVEGNAIYRAGGTDVPVGDGGTGASTFTAHSLLLGQAATAITALGAATDGQIPIGSTGLDPVLATITGTANRVTVSNGAGTITLSGPQDIHTAASPSFAGVTATGTIRADTTFNLNGTNGVSQAAAAGKVSDVTALAGGIATAQTQITYAADGTYNFDATSGKVDSITITNGRITAITVAA